MAGFRYLPVMISRMILSLKKAADPQKMGWPLEVPSVDSTDSRDTGYSRPQGGMNLAESGESPEAYPTHSDVGPMEVNRL